ncbi:MAG: response regulator [Bacillota bacterium]
MYRLMLVDDKPGVIAGLKQLGNWEEMGVTLVGEAFNGEQALRVAEAQQPDLVITDIRMPIMDGLELARRLLDRRPATKVIVLTGHDEFEYARAALKLGAVEFLLKPSTLGEIRAAVRRAVDLLNQERARHDELAGLRQRVQESLPLLRQEYIGRLLRGDLPVPEAELPGLFAFAGVPFGLERLQVIVFGLDMPGTPDPAEAEVRRLSLDVAIRPGVEVAGWVLIRGLDSSPVAIGAAPPGWGEDQVRQEAIALAEASLEAALSHGVPASAGIGRIATGVRDLPRAYREAHAALHQRFFLGTGLAIHAGDLYVAERPPAPYPDWAEEEMLLALRSGNTAQLRASLTEFFRAGAVGGDRDQLYLLCQELTFAASRTLREIEVDGLEPPDLRLATSAADCQEWLGRWLMEAAQQVVEQRQSRQHDAVARVKRYVQEHLGGDCSLQALADHVHLSPTYLAQLFKRQTGQTVLEYVTERKMEQARQLLATTDEKIASICDALGYNDRRHFVDVFRRHTGAAPSEYRQRYRPGAAE